MAGYYNYSMSNNAVSAYENGEMPKSKWTKKAILEVMENMGISEDRLNNYKAMKKNELFNVVMEYSGWHHTSKMYNKTDFYKVSEDILENDFDDQLQEEKAEELKRLIINLKSIREYVDSLRENGISNKFIMEELDRKIDALNENLKFFDAEDVRINRKYYENLLQNGDKL